MWWYNDCAGKGISNQLPIKDGNYQIDEDVFPLSDGVTIDSSVTQLAVRSLPQIVVISGKLLQALKVVGNYSFEIAQSDISINQLSMQIYVNSGISDCNRAFQTYK